MSRVRRREARISDSGSSSLKLRTVQPDGDDTDGCTVVALHWMKNGAVSIFGCSMPNVTHSSF